MIVLEMGHAVLPFSALNEFETRSRPLTLKFDEILNNSE
jgi:hypothetical protein